MYCLLVHLFKPKHCKHRNLHTSSGRICHPRKRVNFNRDELLGGHICNRACLEKLGMLGERVSKKFFGEPLKMLINYLTRDQVHR